MVSAQIVTLAARAGQENGRLARYGQSLPTSAPRAVIVCKLAA
jgi:hypothetical protein